MSERYTWATAADLRWWMDRLGDLREEAEADLQRARKVGSTLLELETLTDRLEYIDNEIGAVLDELEARIARVKPGEI